jgi:hypothetical protein
MDKEKDKSRNEGKDVSTDISPQAERTINPKAFIRQIAVAETNTGTSAYQPASTQADAEQETEDVAVLENRDAVPEVSEESKTKEQGKRRKGQTTAIDYEAVFLARNELSNRQGLYIDRDNYEVLQTLVRSIRSERLSVSGLVDNIISHHIELYGDEINRIFEENIRKPIK